MLSDLQTAMHWRNWAAVCRVNNWRMVKGYLAECDVPSERSEFHARVWSLAEVHARGKHRAVTVDDLRKGCYAFAIGVFKSLTKFDNGDLDRVLCVFELLIKPENLGAVMLRTAYENFDTAQRRFAECKRLGIPVDVTLPDDPGERRRHLAGLRNANAAYVRQICRDKFGTGDWEGLRLTQLRDLTRTVKNRPGAFKPQINADQHRLGKRPDFDLCSSVSICGRDSDPF
jgi:hypothetical protein